MNSRWRGGPYCYVEKVNHLIKITKHQSVMEHALLVIRIFDNK